MTSPLSEGGIELWRIQIDVPSTHKQRTAYYIYITLNGTVYAQYPIIYCI